VTQQLSGWGNEPWGGGPWGDGLPTTMQVIGAFAQAENVFRVQFSQAVYYTGFLDAPDASKPQLYTATPVAGTVGYDGNPARALNVLTVTQPSVAGFPNGTFLDLTTDRPMTPFPAKYLVGVGTVFSADLTQQLSASFSTAVVLAVYAALKPPDPSVSAPMRDVANPQTLAAARRSTADTVGYATLLGTLQYAADGDYAGEQNDDSLRQRQYRRLFCKRGGFVHLPGYGVGVTTYLKRLASTSARDQLAADCQSQFAQEPEAASVRVSTRLDPQNNQLIRLSIFTKKKSGKSDQYTLRLSSQ
jgi:hypothetical protein